jgi:hypothetical protein
VAYFLANRWLLAQKAAEQSVHLTLVSLRKSQAVSKRQHYFSWTAKPPARLSDGIRSCFGYSGRYNVV